MLGLIMGAAILGIIIAVMEQDDFPGWFSMILCVLAAVIPAQIVNFSLGPEFFIVGLLAGAACAGLAISALCGMSYQRAYTAAGIYLGIQLVLGIIFHFLLTTPG